MIEFISQNSGLLQSLSALVSILAIVPAAIIFYLNQREQMLRRREAVYLEANNQFLDFLRLSLGYPELGVAQSCNPVPSTSLTAQKLSQRDTLFEILTSIMERAFIVFQTEKRSFRTEQWEGWLAYIRDYCRREDYQEWWLRIMGGGSWTTALTEGATQYDRAFEVFLFAAIREARSRAETVDRPQIA